MATRNSSGGDYGPTPQTIRPGVMYREADFVGNARAIAQEPDSMERAEKGDLGLRTMVGFDSRALSHPGLPFVLKGGR